MSISLTRSRNKNARLPLFEPFDTNPDTRFAGEDEQELERFIERRKMDRALLLAESLMPTEVCRLSLELVETDLADALTELERRRRAIDKSKGNPFAPTTGRRDGTLIQRASDLKAVWPIDRFCSELLGMTLEGRGDRMRGQCPLPAHDDSNPSFVVYLGQDRAWCYGCQRGGDVIDLTRHYFGLSSFREAITKLEHETRAYHGQVLA